MRDIIVTGTGRCGLSLTMQMLDAGGVETVGEFPAYEEVIDPKDGRGVDEALAGGKGRALKLVDPRNYLPAFERALACCAGVILLHRSPIEQARSQIHFLQFVGELPRGAIHPDSLKCMAASNVRDQKDLVSRTNGVPRLMFPFESLITKPKLVAESFRVFAGGEFDAARAARQVRERFAACLPKMLEPQLLRIGKLLD